MAGLTFNPPDHELVERYLNGKITGMGGSEYQSHIKEVNMCTTEPVDIPSLATMPSRHTWHVFSRVKKLNGNCGQVNRSSKTGSWKISGKKKTMTDLYGTSSGLKTYLTFQEKKDQLQQNESIYNWSMHEYKSYIDHPNKETFVLCKIMRKRKPDIPVPTQNHIINHPIPEAEIFNVFPNYHHLGENWNGFVSRLGDDDYFFKDVQDLEFDGLWDDLQH